MHVLICQLCKESIVSPIVKDDTLGSILVELANHVNVSHSIEYTEYGKNLELLLQILPAYLLVDNFVDVESTSNQHQQTGKLINETQKIVTQALGQSIEIVDSQEIPIEITSSS